MSDDTYTVTATCQNCGAKQIAWIPKGESVGGRTKKCTNCGCTVRFYSFKELMKD